MALKPIVCVMCKADCFSPDDLMSHIDQVHFKVAFQNNNKNGNESKTLPETHTNVEPEVTIESPTSVEPEVTTIKSYTRVEPNVTTIKSSTRVEPKVTTIKSSTRVEPEIPGVGMLNCCLCPHMTVSQSDLEKHIMAEHENIFKVQPAVIGSIPSENELKNRKRSESNKITPVLKPLESSLAEKSTNVEAPGPAEKSTPDNEPTQAITPRENIFQAVGLTKKKGSKPTEYTMMGSTKVVTITSGGYKKYVCPHCPHQAYILEFLRKHILSFHGDGKRAAREKASKARSKSFEKVTCEDKHEQDNLSMTGNKKKVTAANTNVMSRSKSSLNVNSSMSREKRNAFTKPDLLKALGGTNLENVESSSTEAKLRKTNLKRDSRGKGLLEEILVLPPISQSDAEYVASVVFIPFPSEALSTKKRKTENDGLDETNETQMGLEIKRSKSDQAHPKSLKKAKQAQLVAKTCNKQESRLLRKGLSSDEILEALDKSPPCNGLMTPECDISDETEWSRHSSFWETSSLDSISSLEASNANLTSQETSTVNLTSQETSTANFSSQETSTASFSSQETSTANFSSQETSTASFSSQEASTANSSSQETSTANFSSQESLSSKEASSFSPIRQRASSSGLRKAKTQKWPPKPNPNQQVCLNKALELLANEFEFSFPFKNLSLSESYELNAPPNSPAEVMTKFMTSTPVWKKLKVDETEEDENRPLKSSRSSSKSAGTKAKNTKSVSKKCLLKKAIHNRIRLGSDNMTDENNSVNSSIRKSKRTKRPLPKSPNKFVKKSSTHSSARNETKIKNQPNKKSYIQHLPVQEFAPVKRKSKTNVASPLKVKIGNEKLSTAKEVSILKKGTKQNKQITSTPKELPKPDLKFKKVSPQAKTPLCTSVEMVTQLLDLISKKSSKQFIQDGQAALKVLDEEIERLKKTPDKSGISIQYKLLSEAKEKSLKEVEVLKAKEQDLLDKLSSLKFESLLLNSDLKKMTDIQDSLSSVVSKEVYEKKDLFNKLKEEVAKLLKVDFSLGQDDAIILKVKEDHEGEQNGSNFFGMDKLALDGIQFVMKNLIKLKESSMK